MTLISHDSPSSMGTGASVSRIVAAKVSTRMVRKASPYPLVYTSMPVVVCESEEVASRTADQVAGSW
ncbi:hypothetical protein [Streptomyces avermitilis]|uniref:hypothetical protein n=1 Tax=Streptomyces avermitilis TaxID=33903 RepID=UPI0033CFAEAB